MPNFSMYWLLMSLLCWVGLTFAVKDLRARSLPYVFALLVFPLTYCVTLVLPKYRHFVLAGYAVGRHHTRGGAFI
jgi:hypothetical protein